MKISIKALLFITILLFSCDFKDDYDLPSWDVIGSYPIATTVVDYDDLFGYSTQSLDTFMIMKDTVDVDISIPTEILEGSFIVIVKNSFPFDAQLKMELINDLNRNLLILNSENNIRSSDYNLDGQTVKYNESVLVFPFSLLSVMLDRTKKISLEVKLNTLPENQFLDFYKDYSMDMTVIINVEKLISQTILE